MRLSRLNLLSRLSQNANARPAISQAEPSCLDFTALARRITGQSAADQAGVPVRTGCRFRNVHPTDRPLLRLLHVQVQIAREHGTYPDAPIAVRQLHGDDPVPWREVVVGVWRVNEDLDGTHAN